MSNFISELRKTSDGRILHDFLIERFPNGMDVFDMMIVFENVDFSSELKKQSESLKVEFEEWKLKIK